MNILLTTHCSLDCNYCFARALRTAPSEMSMQEVNRLVSKLVPGKDMVRLMGGEPTLHSRYPEILKMFKSQNFDVVVFTNGLHKILRETAPCLPDRILVNINDWRSYSKRQRAAVRKNLAFLGGRASLGYTILEPKFDLVIHRDLILEYDLQPVIRLGIAQPIIGGDNAYLPDSALPEAANQLAAWAETLAPCGIRLSLDCGFVAKHFDDKAIEKMVRAHTVLRFDCKPTIDVGPGLQVSRCFAFSAFEGQSWDNFTDNDQVQAWFTRQDAFLRQTLMVADHRGSGRVFDGCLARQWIREESQQN